MCETWTSDDEERREGIGELRDDYLTGVTLRGETKNRRRYYLFNLVTQSLRDLYYTASAIASDLAEWSLNKP